MAFSFFWILSLINWTRQRKKLWVPKQAVVKNQRSSYTLLPNIPHLDLDRMQWAAWRKWLEHQTSNNFLTTRNNVLITAGKSARLRNSWNKSKLSAHVFLGLCKLSRWKYSKTSVRSEYSKIYNRLIFARISSYVAQRKRHVLQTKPWRMKSVLFLVRGSMLISQMTLWILMCWKVKGGAPVTIL